MSFMMHQQMITGGETRWEKTSPEAKKDFLQEQTQSMGNNGDEGDYENVGGKWHSRE